MAKKSNLIKELDKIEWENHIFNYSELIAKWGLDEEGNSEIDTGDWTLVADTNILADIGDYMFNNKHDTDLSRIMTYLAKKKDAESEKKKSDLKNEKSEMMFSICVIDDVYLEFQDKLKPNMAKIIKQAKMGLNL